MIDLCPFFIDTHQTLTYLLFLGCTLGAGGRRFEACHPDAEDEAVMHKCSITAISFV
jgi:hypothetical protein